MSVAVPVARIEILRDVTLNDDDFQYGWSAYGGTLSTDGEIGTATINAGYSSVFISKPLSFIHHYAIINCTELTGSSWRLEVRRASDQIWVYGSLYNTTGIKTINIDDIYSGDIDMIGIRVFGVPSQHAKFDYIVISNKPMLTPTDFYDVLDMRAHLGMLDEVGSFELTMQNFDAKYTGQISVGDQIKMWLGRQGSGMPKIFTGRIEEVQFDSSPTENYIVLRGRDRGEELFRRTVTKTYENMKAEAIVADLIENFTNLKHARGSTELIENTDTTFSLLEYDGTPVFDILKDIAKGSNKNGVVGFDFRIEPDGKFAFFQRNSKTSLVSLSERTEVARYRKDISRIRNKITVFGAAEKAYPNDKDSWTEDVTCADGNWSIVAGDSITKDTGTKVVGIASVKLAVTTPNYYGSALFTLNSGKEVDCNKYLSFNFQIRRESGYSGAVEVKLEDDGGHVAVRSINIHADTWIIQKFLVGEKHRDEWNYFSTPFNWGKVKKIRIDCIFNGTGTGSFWVDNLFFNSKRWESTRENTNSQNTYGLRELVEVDEELHSDNECQRRAESQLDFLKDPAEYLTLNTRVLDFGNNWLLPGDKIHVALPNENIDTDYRILTVEYQVRAREQTLETTLELGKEPSKLVSLLTDMHSETNNLARYKAGPTGVAGTASGGGSNGDGMQQHGNEWHDPDMALLNDFNTHAANSDAHHAKVHGNESHDPDFSAVGHSHVEADISNLDHNAQKIKGKVVDDSGIGDGKVLGYNQAQDKIVYMAGGGGGAHADTHESGGNDQIDGWIRPSHIGPRSDASAIIYFRTENIAGGTPVDHRFAPSITERGFIGTPSSRWSKVYTKDLDMTGSLSVNQLVVSPNPIWAYGDVIMCSAGKTMLLPNVASADVTVRPQTAGYSYIGSATYWFKQMHAVSFTTHSMKPIKGNLISMIKAIQVNKKDTFPNECRDTPTRDAVIKDLRETLKNRIAQQILEQIKNSQSEEKWVLLDSLRSIPPESYEPTETQIQEELAKENIQGIKLEQTISLLIDTVKILIAKLETLGVTFS